MSTERGKDETTIPFETQEIDPRDQWFDPIGIRYFINTTDQPIRIGFSHNIRAVEIIAILKPTEEDLKSKEIQALEGEIIEEDL